MMGREEKDSKPKLAFMEHEETDKDVGIHQDMSLTKEAENFLGNVGIQGLRYVFMKKGSWQRK